MFKKAKDTIDKALEIILVVLMSSSVLNVLWQVFTRFGLHHPSSWTEELARYLLIWIGLLGASYAAGKKMHLPIDILLLKLKGRARKAAELSIQISIFLFALMVMAIGGFRLVAMTLKLNQVSAALKIKLGYVYLALPLSGFLIMFYSFVFFREKAKERKSQANLSPTKSKSLSAQE
jgi:TRAP-type C4-dicarboxylate transport system permease small subunit